MIVLHMQEETNINQAYSLIKQDEKQRQGFIPTISDNMALAFVANFSSGKKGYTEIECTYCHSKNHLREKRKKKVLPIEWLSSKTSFASCQ